MSEMTGHTAAFQTANGRPVRAEHVITFTKGGWTKPLRGNGARGWRSASRSASSFV